jgi:uroporphyrinogen-III decarboxylase
MRCLKIGAKDGGFILMPGCDVPHETPAENLKAMMKAARNYKL